MSVKKVTIMPNFNNSHRNEAVNRLVLSNGITLLVVENPTADLVAGRIFLKNAGTRWENRQQAGISHLLASVITKGTRNLSSIEIAEKIESIGANLGADASADYFGFSWKTVAADFQLMLHLIAEIVRFPTFPEIEVELEKRLTIQSIRSQQEQPFNVGFNQLREAMYQDHPYAFSLLGTEETVSKLTSEDLHRYHQNYFRPDNLVISLSGRLDLNQTINFIKDAFDDWDIPPHSLPFLQLPPIPIQPCQKMTPQETQQAIVMLGYLASGVKNREDYTALKLLNTYLGNGLSSRLFVELREKRGLAYDVSGFYPTRLDNAQFVVYMGTAPENTAIALEGLRHEVERLVDQKLSSLEIKAAKNKLLGQYALGKQTNAEIAQIYGWYETLDLGIEFDHLFCEQINLIDADKLQNVALSYLTQPYVSLVGPYDIIKHQITL
jgi:predicted Zn-dependent peptidase